MGNLVCLVRNVHIGRVEHTGDRVYNKHRMHSYAVDGSVCLERAVCEGHTFVDEVCTVVYT